MKATKYALTIAIVLGLVIANQAAAVAATSANTAVAVSATIVASALTLTKVTDIAFGSIIADPLAPCSLTLDARTGGATALPVPTSNCTVLGGNSGKLTMTTNINTNVTVNYSVKGGATGSGAADTLLISGGPETIPFTATDIAAKSTLSPLGVTVTGPNEIYVGGILTVAAAQAPGSYEGQVTVNVHY